MLNNNQSGNTNHSLVILHATLNVCGKSAANFARQRTTDRSFFFCFFFVVFRYYFAFLISASVCVLRPLPQNFGDTVSLAAATAANTTTTTRAKKRNNNYNYNGIKLNENYRTFAAAAHWRTRKFE